MQRIGVGCQRFHTLAFDGQHQPPAVIGEPGVAVLVPQRFAQLIDIPLEFGKLWHEDSPPTRISMHNTMNLLTQ